MPLYDYTGNGAAGSVASPNQSAELVMAIWKLLGVKAQKKILVELSKVESCSVLVGIVIEKGKI